MRLCSSRALNGDGTQVRKIVPAAALCGALFATGVLWPNAAQSHNPVTTTVLFNREVSKILNAKCAQCHRSGGMAMPLQTFEQVRPWAQAIKEEVLARHMPPWFAEEGYGAFANGGELTARERDFLISWIEGGTPEGSGDPSPFVDHSAHWMLGDPDRILRGPVTSAIKVAPRGFVRFILDPDFPVRMLLRAIDFKPGDSRARAAFFSLAETGEYLGAWTPWHPSTELPPQTALLVPARAKIAVDVWYGRATPDRSFPSSVALYLAKGRPSTVTSRAILSVRTPGTAVARVMRTVPRATTLVALRPEMGPGARSLEVKAVTPDGAVLPLLWIRTYRPDWPAPVIFASPVSLPAGSTIQAIGHFDPASGPRFTLHVQSFDPGSRPAAPIQTPAPEHHHQ